MQSITCMQVKVHRPPAHRKVFPPNGTTALGTAVTLRHVSHDILLLTASHLCRWQQLNIGLIEYRLTPNEYRLTQRGTGFGRNGAPNIMARFADGQGEHARQLLARIAQVFVDSGNIYESYDMAGKLGGDPGKLT